MGPYIFENLSELIGSRIVVVGVGNSGKNIINCMIKDKLSGVEFIIANTDIDNGYEDLRSTLKGAALVIIVVGLGGATGTYAAATIAKIAKDVALLTICVVSKPFCFEDERRLYVAEEGLEILKIIADSVVLIPNNKLLPNIDIKFESIECFHNVDSAFARVINGISRVILPSSENDISLDFFDLQVIMHRGGIATVGIGVYQGVDAACKAINNATIFAMVDGIFIQEDSAVLVHFHIHPEFHYKDISVAMEVLQQSLEEGAEVVFGTTTDKSLPLDYVSVIIIGSGVERRELMAVNNVF